MGRRQQSKRFRRKHRSSESRRAHAKREKARRARFGGLVQFPVESDPLKPRTGGLG